MFLIIEGGSRHRERSSHAGGQVNKMRVARATRRVSVATHFDLSNSPLSLPRLNVFVASLIVQIKGIVYLGSIRKKIVGPVMT